MCGIVGTRSPHVLGSDEQVESRVRTMADMWVLFILEQWFQMWIDPPTVPREPPPPPRIDA